LLDDAMSFEAFKNFHQHQEAEGKPIAANWLKWPPRRTFSKLAFDPSGKSQKGAFNLWRGFAIEPGTGECELLLAHLHDVWCSGNDAQFQYVIRWMALLMQRPWEKPEIALVLRSEQGSGKTIIVDVLLKILGCHGFTTARKDQVAGKFNAHLFDKVLVVLEEAFFAGDPEAVASANALITNRQLGYEPKGKPTFSAPNYAHVISLTNNKWAVPAGADARRWMVLDVSDARRGNHGYFEALAKEINNGGAEAFLHYLMGVDLTGFNPRALPDSVALRTQMRETLFRTDPVASWWLSVLADGEFAVKDGAVPWGTEIDAADFRASYELATTRMRTPPPFNVAMQKVRKFLPAGALGKIRKGSGDGRYFSYKLPDLTEARAKFKQETKIDPTA
jgi:hypothetical protein